ncbi:MAG: hypothetical protein ABSE81_00210 [Candidatus Omnitrophota bacterium]|jgi:hypothetical protein
MSAQEIILNIAVNLGRIGRYAYEGKCSRVEQFLNETDEYVRQLESIPLKPRFKGTFYDFKKSLNELEKDMRLDTFWAETAYTWANILTHRAKLAG